MKRRIHGLLTALVLSTCAVLAAAQTTQADLGKREYEAKCANCHGLNGKGQGPFVPFLKRSPPDLSTLAKANGGILPMDRLYQSISGSSIAAHGARDMPIWGREYNIEAANHYMDVPYDAEAYVRLRLLMLLEYINRLQVK